MIYVCLLRTMIECLQIKCVLGLLLCLLSGMSCNPETAAFGG
jgi:hypothetical protein